MSPKFYIYAIFNTINGKIYIGKAEHPDERWHCHQIYAMGGKEKYPSHFQYIHAAIAKHGVNNFIFKVIDEHCDEIDCFSAEEFWIDFFKSHDRNYGYNLTLGGEGSSGRIVSDETKDKIRQKAIGRLHSEDTKNKISEAGKLRTNSEETRKKISISNKGRKLTDAQRIAQSIRQIGKILPQSQIDNMIKSAKRGEKSPRAKLTNEQAQDMRNLYKTGNYKIKELAKIFNVGATSASYILNNKTYK